MSIQEGSGRALGPFMTAGRVSMGFREEERRETEISGVFVLLCSQRLSYPGSQGPEGTAPLDLRARKSAAPRGATQCSQKERAFSLHTGSRQPFFPDLLPPLPWGSSIWILPAQLLKGPPPPHQFPTCPASHLGDAPASPSPSFSLSPLGSPFDRQG